MGRVTALAAAQGVHGTVQCGQQLGEFGAILHAQAVKSGLIHFAHSGFDADHQEAGKVATGWQPPCPDTAITGLRAHRAPLHRWRGHDLRQRGPAAVSMIAHGDVPVVPLGAH